MAFRITNPFGETFEYIVKKNGELLTDKECEELEYQLYHNNDIDDIRNHYCKECDADYEIDLESITNSVLKFTIDPDDRSCCQVFKSSTKEGAAEQLLFDIYDFYYSLYDLINEIVKKYIPDAVLIISSDFKDNKQEYIKNNVKAYLSCAEDTDDWEDDDFRDYGIEI